MAIDTSDRDADAKSKAQSIEAKWSVTQPGRDSAAGKIDKAERNKEFRKEYE